MQPSFIKKVDYTKLVAELCDTKFSGDPQQDVFVKKLAADVNVGLVEKRFNKKSAGFLFQDYEECRYYQGSIHSFLKIDDISEFVERSPLGLDDGIDMSGPVVSVKVEHRGSPYFILVLKAEKQLRNCFRV
jgi:hypothetical protein